MRKHNYNVLLCVYPMETELNPFIVDLKRELSSFDLMLRKIQMTRKSPYGAFCVKLNYMEWMKQGSDFLRQVAASISSH